MRERPLERILHWCRSWRPFTARRVKGHVAVMMAVLLTSLMGLAGAGVDYGLIVIESSRLQNALDAASLAGARALVLSTSTTQGAATNPATGTRNYEGQQAAKNFLVSNGYNVTGADGVTFTFTMSPSVTGASHDTMLVIGTVVKPTNFWKAIGINSTTITQRATAVSTGGMVDVMLSLDLTYSMELSGGDDIENLQAAVDAFIDQMQISPTVSRGTRMGMARWAGVKCSWHRGATISGTPAAGVADGDQNIDVDRGPASNTGEYTAPCYDDATVLSWLSTNKDQLKRISSDTPSATACPSAPAAPATPTNYSPATMVGYACPLKSWRLPISNAGIPQVNGTPTTISGVQGGSVSQYTGTKLSNAIRIVNGDVTGCYAWATSATGCPTNGRNDPVSADGLARKVLVIMTDGFSQGPLTIAQEGIPSTYPTYTTTRTPVVSLAPPTSWNAETLDLADRLKKGPDGNLATTEDNVEIYVVGFFPVPYNGTPGQTNWARSRAAATGSVSANNHPCPAAVLPLTSDSPKRFSFASDSIAPGVDELLNNISSSTSGSCDHYFPIAKSEGTSLPQLFRVMAGSIARGRLQ